MGTPSGGGHPSDASREIVRLGMWGAALVVFWVGLIVHIIG
jgi:hypothetical protein